MLITRLENLSNEILYEIFEYLDGCFVFNTFTNLNTRFEYLLQYSSLPLKLNLSWTSKSTFEHYSKHIITPNLTRIISLYIPNPSAIKFFLSSFSIESSFTRLESLNLGRMNSDCIISLLTRLKSLSHLFSLSININNPQYNINTIYQLIVTLPGLKYCKISSEYGAPIFSVPISVRSKTLKESPIERLIINGVCRFDQFDGILSYTPRLTHLSCHSLYISSGEIRESIILTNLRALHIELGSISFDLFKLFIYKVSSRLEVLRMSATYEKAYLDANQWEQLISYQMPYLRIFDFQFQSELCDNDTKSMEYDKLIEQFNSEFWAKRKWFFTYQNRLGSYGHFKIFYSIRPYRRNYYKLFEQYTSDNLEILPYQDNSVHSCRHVFIENRWSIIDRSLRFPYATKLTLTGSYAPEIPSLIINLSNIISLTKITEFVLEYEYIFLNKFLTLLEAMPNISSLTIPQTAIIQTRNLSENEIELVRMLSKRNHVTKVTINNRECTFKQLRFLFNLCPQIEYFTIHLSENDEDLMMKFFISKMKENNYRFFLLCLVRWDATNNMIKRIHSIIDQENLLHNYSLDLFQGNMYLWC